MNDTSSIKVVNEAAKRRRQGRSERLKIKIKSLEEVIEKQSLKHLEKVTKLQSNLKIEKETFEEV